MSAPKIWMPWHIGDYLRDTMRLTTVQHGAYGLLLMHYWLNGPLPDDDEELAAITKLAPADWGQMAKSIRRFFKLGTDGLLHQKRADAELLKAADLSQKRRAAVAQRKDRIAKAVAERAAKTPAGKDSTIVEQLNVQAQAQAHVPSLKKRRVSPNGLTASEQATLPTIQELPPQDCPTPVEQAALEGVAIRLWNTTAQSSGMPRITAMSKTRRAHLRARLRDHGLEGWQRALTAAEASDHWQGRTTGWRGSFDDFVNETKFLKLIEGGFANRRGYTNGRSSNGRADPHEDLYRKYGIGDEAPAEEGLVLDMEDL